MTDYIPFGADLIRTAYRIDRGVADLARERDEALQNNDPATAQWKQAAIDTAEQWAQRCRREGERGGRVDPGFFQQAQQVANAANCSGILIDGRPMAQRTADTANALFGQADKEAWERGEHPTQRKAQEIGETAAFGHVAGPIGFERGDGSTEQVEQVPFWRLGMAPGEHDAQAVQDQEADLHRPEAHAGPQEPTEHTNDPVRNEEDRTAADWKQTGQNLRDEAEVIRAEADVETDEQTQEALYDEAAELDKGASYAEDMHAEAVAVNEAIEEAVANHRPATAEEATEACDRNEDLYGLSQGEEPRPRDSAEAYEDAQADNIQRHEEATAIAAIVDELTGDAAPRAWQQPSARQTEPWSSSEGWADDHQTYHQFGEPWAEEAAAESATQEQEAAPWTEQPKQQHQGTYGTTDGTFGSAGTVDSAMAQQEHVAVEEAGN